MIMIVIVIILINSREKTPEKSEVESPEQEAFLFRNHTVFQEIDTFTKPHTVFLSSVNEYRLTSLSWHRVSINTIKNNTGIIQSKHMESLQKPMQYTKIPFEGV